MSDCRADLHAHTTASDGTLAPAALAEKAAQAGLAALAVTDHDTFGGLAEAQAAGQRAGVEVIAGVELSVTVDGEEVHLLGYFFDPEHAGLRQHVQRFTEARRERARRMSEKLTTLGRPLTLEDVERQAGAGGVLARPHVAQALVEAGHVTSTQAAFDEFLADGRPACVEKPTFPADEALRLLHDAGGVGSLAHPGDWISDAMLRRLARAGLDAVEVVHPAHDARLTRHWRRAARAHALQETGGSDYHGHRANDEKNFGAYTVSCRQVAPLRP